MGEVVSYARGGVIENVVVQDAATAGVGVFRAGNTVRNVTIQNAGASGLQASEADGLTVDNIVVDSSNAQHFNFAPASAGMKIARTAGLAVSNSKVTNSWATGLWLDEDVRDAKIQNDQISGNMRNGIMAELSARVEIGNNLLFDNGGAVDPDPNDLNAMSGGESILISDTVKATIHDNTVVGPAVAIHMYRDTRTRATNGGAQDGRQLNGTGDSPLVAPLVPASSDPDLDWNTRGEVIQRKVLQNSATWPKQTWGVVVGENQAGIADSGKTQMVQTSDTNVYGAISGGNLARFITWQGTAVTHVGFATLADYVQATGQDQHSVAQTSAVVDASMKPTVTAAGGQTVGSSLTR